MTYEVVGRHVTVGLCGLRLDARRRGRLAGRLRGLLRLRGRDDGIVWHGRGLQQTSRHVNNTTL